MKRVLITGGKGFLMSRTTKTYQGKWEILSLDRAQLDITDHKAVSQTFESFQPTHVIHAAAIAMTQVCEDHPDIAYRVNTEAAEYIAKECKKHQAKLLFFSTEQVFNGNPEPGPYSVDTTPVPDTVYGQNKYAAEQKIQALDVDAVILRLSWLFGLPERNLPNGYTLFWDVFSAALRHQPTSASPHEFRGVTCAYDLIDQFDSIFALPAGIYHFGSENTMSRYETARLILKEINLSDEVIDATILCAKEKFKDHPRDLRLDYTQTIKAGIRILPTEESIRKELAAFHYSI
jgi:dTDP-4-dehydrorhamnose reductase